MSQATANRKLIPLVRTDLKYADYLGIKNVVDRGDNWAGLSPIYRPSERLRAMAAVKEVFYPRIIASSIGEVSC